MGDESSGKSCFMSRLVYDDFSLIKEHSIGIQIGQVEAQSTEFACIIDLWDLAHSSVEEFN